MTVGQIKDTIASYLKVKTYDFLVNDVDTLLIAINNARRTAERLHDFRYSEASVTLSIATGGTALAATTKRVRRVSLPIAGGDYLPIEFMTYDEWLARLRRQTGRAAYLATNTLAQCGVSQVNPVAYQQGQSLFLVPASQFTFPVAAKLDTVQLQPDYVDDTSTDFFTVHAPEFLQFRAILEGNKYWKEFVPRQEGGLDEPQQLADEAFQALIEWDNSLSQSTSTPIQQASQT